jgi:hypothetical protein
MILTASQLADLVNYALGLPVKLGQRTILEPAIHPCVVSTWNWKQRVKCELWCEEVLRLEGLIAGEKKPERRPRCAPPGLRKIALQPVLRVEQMSQQKRELRRVAG